MIKEAIGSLDRGRRAGCGMLACGLAKKASASANSRLVALDERGVTFRYKDDRLNGPARYCTMTLTPDEFIRRFLLHVLPKGFHRIRYYGLLASATCKANVARAKELITAPLPQSIPQRNTTSRTWLQAPLQIIARHALVAAGA
jgi:hypothetical protein